MATWAVTRGVDTGTGYTTAAEQITGTGELKLSESLSIGTDTQVVCTVDVSAVKVFFLYSSTAATVETNATNGSVNVFTLAAGVPFLWTSTQGGSFRDTAGTAVSTDITTIYVTNAASTTFVMQVLTDATP